MLIEMFSWPFMQRALIAGVLVSLCAAPQGRRFREAES